MASSQADNDAHVQEFRRFVQQQSQQGTLGATTGTNTADSRFLPDKALDEYFKDDACLLSLLKAVIPFDGHRPVRLCTLRRRFIKIFAILLCIGHGNFIKLFVEDDDLSDKKLPFTNRPTTFPSAGASDEQFFISFSNQQWMFCAPTLTYEPYSYWPARRILPIIDKQEIGDGGSAKTYKIKVHPDYNRLGPKNSDDPHANIFVLKIFKPNDLEDSYRKEVQAFVALRTNTARNPSMIGFYGSYRHGESCNLILEYANEGTLEDYLQKCSPPTTGPDIYKFWSGLLGLIKALEAIHYIVSGDSSPVLQGWHQDIKPRNILVSRRNCKSLYECEFKLADLGLSHIGIKVGENAQYWSTQGTRTYGPPECYRSELFTAMSRLPASQKADIWSLGAILSEVAMWLYSGGAPGIRGYSELRIKKTREISRFRDAGCFHNGEVVLPCVLQTHKALRQKTHKRDNLTGLILDMIDSMLSPSHVRLDAKQCAFQTTNILQKAEAMIDDSRDELRRSALPPTISIPPPHSSNQSLSARISPQNSPSPMRTSQNAPNGMTPNGSLTPPLTTRCFTLPNLSVEKAREWRNRRKTHRSGFKEYSLPDCHLLVETKNRDHVFIIDDSSSMCEHWDKVLDLLDTLAYIVKPLDPDGVEIYFTINDEHYTKRNSSDLVRIAERARPLKCSSRLSNISIKLGSILEDYEKGLKKPERGWFGPREVRKKSIYVFTDGVWRPQADAAGPIKSLVSTLEQLRKPRNQIGIQFIQFGGDVDGHARLAYLDSQMGLSMDIVDTEPCNGNVWKMLLGALDPWFDSDASPYSEAVRPPTPPE
ncbi:kinase-like protein [Cenococcum geophilum]